MSEFGEERLKQLYLLPPSMTTPWAGVEGMTVRSKVRRKGQSSVRLQLPLFWFDPHWYRLPTQIADELAVAVAELNVVVSGLRSDLAVPNSEPMMHQDQSVDDESSESEDEDSSPPEPRFLPRMVSYRPERYGLTPADFDNAKIVDVRLMMSRDASGRFAYSPEQLARWEATPADQPLAGGGWVPAASFPPDVASIDHLSVKLNQLRKLSPGAAVFVSVGPYRLGEEIPALISSQPDGLIVRMDQVDLDGLQLAALTRRVRSLMNEAGAKQMPLWVVPGEISADDAVKLVALGASAIGVDNWCNQLIDQCLPAQGSYGYSRPPIEQYVSEALEDRIERFSGLYLSLQRVKRKERLGSFRMTWAKTLGVKPLQ